MAWQPGLESAVPVDQVLVEESQRAFMARVYRWMFVGLAVTGGVALATVSHLPLLQFVARNYLWLLGGELLLVLGLSAAAPRMSALPAGLLFLAYAALNGLTFSILFAVYTGGSIGQAFFITAGAFGAMSLYGTITKKDLSAWASFLFIGLIGVVIAAVVNIFVNSGMLSFVWACASVVVFAGLTAYDTQKLRQMHAVAGYTSEASYSIVGALVLYLDFINLFLALLRLFGRRR